MDFSPDGRLLVSSSLDGVRLLDMDTFAEVGYLPSKPTSVIAFHPDGNRLFTYGSGGLHCWPIRREIERAATRPVETEVLHIGPSQALDVPGNWKYAGFSLDRQGHRLSAVDFSHGRAIVLDLGASGRKIVLENPAIAGCFLSPDGERALTTFVGPGLQVWNTSDGKPVPWSPPAGERFLCFTADSNWLVTAPQGQLHFHFWQIGTGQLDSSPANNKRLTSPSASPDGSVWLWVDSRALPPKLFNTHTERLLAVLEPPRDIGCAGWRFSPDGEKLVVLCGNHTMHVWDLREIRRELADLGLDWDLPPYPPKTPRDSRPIRVEVMAAKPAP
jgi:WD40 repeat protein